MRSLKFYVLVLILLAFPSLSVAYTSPIGIPNPSASFSTFGEIDQATPDTATKCPNWPSAASAGCYYIDNTAAGNTDSANTNGYPEKPRTSIPGLSGLSAGSFVYVNAGSYTQTLTVNGAGTDANPIWITGNSSVKPTINRDLSVGKTVSTSYLVIENINFPEGYGIDLRPTADNVVIDHILLRYLNWNGNNTLGLGGGISIGGTVNYSGSSNSYIVTYSNNIAGLGDKSINDNAGVYVQKDSDYIWVLDSIIHDIGGDGVAGCYACTTAANDQPTNYFVGRNQIYKNGENCVDLKGVQGFVISQNDCYGPFGREQGWGFVIHNQSEPQTCPSNGWIIFNRIHSTSSGIALVTCNNENMHIIGNLIYDMHLSNCIDGCDWQSENGIIVASSAGVLDIIDNTIYDVDNGIIINNTLIEGDSAKIHGNIISGRSNADKYELNLASNGFNYIDVGYNLFYGPSGTSEFYWNGSARTYADLLSAGECGGESPNCVNGSDPLFVDPPNSFALQALSPAIGVSVEGPVGVTAYDAFNTAWEISIEIDLIGTARPQDGTWDMGAIEYLTEGSDTTAPTLSETTPVSTPTTDSTPSVVVNSNEACTPSYSGTAGSGSLTSLASGANTITFGPLNPGAYTSALTCTDASANASDSLSLTGFTVRLPGNKVLGSGSGKSSGGGSGKMIGQ